MSNNDLFNADYYNNLDNPAIERKQRAKTNIETIEAAQNRAFIAQTHAYVFDSIRNLA